MEMEVTGRGFARGNFTDRNGVECSLQESSLATERCIWLGCDELDLQMFIPNGRPSWRKVNLHAAFPLAESFVANTRMHLSQAQVAELLPALQHFVETGELPDG